MNHLAHGVQAIVVGCSAGGLNALHRLLGQLVTPLPVPIILMCHSGSEDMATFCDLLQRSACMEIAEAEERSVPLPGHIYVAPSGYHLLVERDGRFALNVDPRVEYARPSINVLFETAARAWGAGLIAVVLTGANADGALGAVSVRQAGGMLVVQDPATAEMPIMPAEALALAGADYCMSLMEIPMLLESLCRR